MHDDHGAIGVVINTYLEAVRTGRAELWGQVFHPQATVVNASRGTADFAAAYPQQQQIHSAVGIRCGPGCRW
jgi:hypothetical protein